MRWLRLSLSAMTVELKEEWLVLFILWQLYHHSWIPKENSTFRLFLPNTPLKTGVELQFRGQTESGVSLWCINLYLTTQSNNTILTWLPELWICQWKHKETPEEKNSYSNQPVSYIYSHPWNIQPCKLFAIRTFLGQEPISILNYNKLLLNFGVKFRW